MPQKTSIERFPPAQGIRRPSALRLHGIRGQSHPGLLISDPIDPAAGPAMANVNPKTVLIVEGDRDPAAVIMNPAERRLSRPADGWLAEALASRDESRWPC